jgi:tetratricopeptide (TPR) repeat protein
MSECTDKKIAVMIHHYELGLLEDRDRVEFEQHLLECESCLNKVKSLQMATYLMKADPTIRSLAQKTEASESAKSISIRDRIQNLRILKLKYLPAIVTVAVVLTILVLKDWQFEIRPSHVAVADENRLAIMYFENQVDKTDTNRLGKIASNLLITDLAESQYLQTVSLQRVYDILRQLGMEDRKIISHDLALNIATQTNSRWLLIGDILQTAPNLIVSIQLLEAKSGQVQATRRIEGRSGDDIFSIVDSLTVLIKQDLALPPAAFQEPDRRIATVTTSSEAAYRHYLEGVENLQRVYNIGAIASFKKALEFDSTFAMAYYYLANLEDSDYIKRALHFSDSISWREKIYIQASYAARFNNISQAIELLDSIIKRDPKDKHALSNIAGIYHFQGNFNKSSDYCLRLIEIDPLNRIAYNGLAYAYHGLDKPDSAIWAINKYIELAPGEANPYDTRGDLYSASGKLSEAISSYHSALQINPEFYYSLEKLGHMHVFTNEYAVADSCYKILAEWDDPIVAARALIFPAYIPLYQGKFFQALEILDESIRSAQIKDEKGTIAHMRKLKALIYSELEMADKAMEEIQLSLEIIAETNPDNKLNYHDLYIRLLIQNGRLIEAESEAEELHETLLNSGLSSAIYWFARAIIERNKGNLDSAVAIFDRYAAEPDKSPYFNRRYLMALTYFECGRLSDAVNEFEKLTSGAGSIQLYWGMFHAKANYFLGRAYEESRWFDRAAEQYQIFLNRWRDSDYTGPELDDARARLMNLLSKT